MTSDVSVIIPSFNRAAVIGIAIDSVLSQKADVSIDVIVVDDGSSDDLTAALARFERGVRLIRHERNSGAAAARNTAIAAAGGEFVAFLDSDDIWLPGKLARQIAEMNERGWQASCTAYVLAKAGSNDLVSPRFASGALTLDQMVWGCFVSPGSTLMCRRSLFADVGLFDTRLKRLEDWDWLLRLVRTHPLGFLAEPLARIAPSQGADAAKVLPALDGLWAKHAGGLGPSTRRHFAAALNVERAAAFYRDGNWFRAVQWALRSLSRAPIGNAALGAVFHNLGAPSR